MAFRPLLGVRSHILGHSNDAGMTLVEVIVALLMLVAFGSTFVAVTEFTSKFMRESENGLPGTQGLLIDQHNLQVVMDQLVEILDQPGLSIEDLSRIQAKGCVFDPMSGDLNAESGSWGLPGPAVSLPPGYQVCLHSTSLAETPIDKLLDQAGSPGIYLIQALPETKSASALPARRLFCRPKPFC